MGAAIVFGIGGGIVLSGLPVVGTLFGAFIGALIGMGLVEWIDKRNLHAAVAAVRTYIGGTLLATVVEVGVSISDGSRVCSAGTGIAILFRKDD